MLQGYATSEQYPDFGALSGDISEFSGTMAYECEYDSPAARRALVKIEDCNEVAEVFVDGKSQGFSIAPPYGVEVELPAGKCGIRIEITNTLGHQQHAYEGGYFSGPTVARGQGIFGNVELIG